MTRCATHDVPPHGGGVHALCHVHLARRAHVPQGAVARTAYVSFAVELEVVGGRAQRGMRTRWPCHVCVIHRGCPGDAPAPPGTAPPLPTVRRRCCSEPLPHAWMDNSPLSSHLACASQPPTDGMTCRSERRRVERRRAVAVAGVLLVSLAPYLIHVRRTARPAPRARDYDGPVWQGVRIGEGPDVIDGFQVRVRQHSGGAALYSQRCTVPAGINKTPTVVPAAVGRAGRRGRSSSCAGRLRPVCLCSWPPVDALDRPLTCGHSSSETLSSETLYVWSCK